MYEKTDTLESLNYFSVVTLLESSRLGIKPWCASFQSSNLNHASPKEKIWRDLFEH